MEPDDTILGLAAIRQSKGISLEQISNATKITVRSLRAIEMGEFKKLPGGIYNISYIRQYARAIDFDECELLQFYYSKMGGQRPQELPIEELFTGLRPASTIVGS